MSSYWKVYKECKMFCNLLAQKPAPDKIKSVLPVRNREYLENLNSHIKIVYAEPTPAKDFPNNFLTDIQRSFQNI